MGKRVSFEDAYRIYTERYDAMQKTVEKKGSSMYSDKMYKDSFKVQYNLLKKRTPKSQKASAKSLVNKLVSAQSSEYTYKQAKVIQQTIEAKQGRRLTLNEIRYGTAIEDMMKVGEQKFMEDFYERNGFERTFTDKEKRDFMNNFWRYNIFDMSVGNSD